MKVNIRRGANEIGGSAVEVTAANGERIILDLGLPLDANENSADLLPDIKGLTKRTSDLLGLFISHPHQDHFALGLHIDKTIPVYMGKTANKIMRAGVKFNLPNAFTFENVHEFESWKPFQLGAFKITPYLVDHSGYDSYAFLVETDGKRLFYSGDFRSHGRKGELFEHFIKRPPKSIDVMLMEGSSLDRLESDKRFESEEELEGKFIEIFKNTQGLALVHPSSQNIDRIVTIYRATKKANRILVMGGYTGFIMMSLENPHIPNFTWSDVKKIVKTPTGKKHEITAEQIAAAPKKYVFILGAGVLTWLEKAGLLNPSAHYIYSMWEGYRESSADRVVAVMERTGVPQSYIHTSGHADIPTLLEFVAAVKPARLVPIHTFKPEYYFELFGDIATVELQKNNEEFEV
ncbi:MAG: hypothetical protein LBH05_05120 [Deferribacteraceae bacterium]|jgi:ribonuclease J|nr:hypothetical protein [Deferribacteraceae bacterium]